MQQGGRVVRAREAVPAHGMVTRPLVPNLWAAAGGASATVGGSARAISMLARATVGGAARAVSMVASASSPAKGVRASAAEGLAAASPATRLPLVFPLLLGRDGSGSEYGHVWARVFDGLGLLSVRVIDKV